MRETTLSKQKTLQLYTKEKTIGSFRRDSPKYQFCSFFSTVQKAFDPPPSLYEGITNSAIVLEHGGASPPHERKQKKMLGWYFGASLTQIGGG